MSFGRGKPDPLRRIITTHDSKSARATLATRLMSRYTLQVSGFPVSPGKPTTSNYALAYNTCTFPVQGLPPPTSTTAESKVNIDIKHYSFQLSDPSPLNPPNGTTCTVIEIPPGLSVPMLGYVDIIDGTTELVLDSGEKRILKKDDIFVPRGAAHSWRNMNGTKDNSGVLHVLSVFHLLSRCYWKAER